MTRVDGIFRSLCVVIIRAAILAGGLAACSGEVSAVGDGETESAARTETKTRTEAQTEAQTEAGAETGNTVPDEISGAGSVGELDEAVELNIASEPPAPKKPKRVTIDDIKDTLRPVEFVDLANGVRATPTQADVIGRLTFVVPKGVDADGYKNFAHIVAGNGFEAHILDGDTELSAFDGAHVEDSCTVIGTIGDRAKGLIDYGMAHRGRVDGVVIAAFAFDDPETDYTKRLPIAVILGGQDGVRPPETKNEQVLQWPGQTYFLTVNEANHSGYYEGRTFENDGEALVEPDQQRLILGELAARMTGRFCRTRDKELSDGARKGAREAGKTAEE